MFLDYRQDQKYVYCNDGSIWSKSQNKWLSLGKHRKGYLQFVDCNFKPYKMVLVHRRIYQVFNGEIPDSIQVNHINGIKYDNRLVNLNLLTPQQNQQYRGKNKNNSSGYKNVYKHGDGWRVQFCVDGELKCFGTYKSPERANEIAREIEDQLNGLGHNFISEYPI